MLKNGISCELVSLTECTGLSTELEKDLVPLELHRSSRLLVFGGGHRYSGSDCEVEMLVNVMADLREM